MQNQQQIQRQFREEKPKTLNVGVIGCGRIAEHHLRFVERTGGARFRALSDPIVADARRFAHQYGVRKVSLTM